jgi:hypothetical protein
MSRTFADAGVEPTLTALMSDPIMDLLLKYDRLSPADVWRAITVARRKLRLRDARADPTRVAA